MATDFSGLENLLYTVGGGQQQAQQGFDALNLAQQMEGSRNQMGMSLLDYITKVQQDPFSIVPALQMYGQAGGGTLAPAAALAASGGQMNSPYGDIAANLIRNLSTFAGGAPVNPKTGRSFTPDEMAYINVAAANQPKTGGTTGSKARTRPPAGQRPGSGPELQPFSGVNNYISELAPATAQAPGGVQLSPEVMDVLSRFGHGQAPGATAQIGTSVEDIARAVRGMKTPIKGTNKKKK